MHVDPSPFRVTSLVQPRMFMPKRGGSLAKMNSGNIFMYYGLTSGQHSYVVNKYSCLIGTLRTHKL